MKGIQIVGILLLGLGILALVYKGFTYTTDSDSAKLGPIEIAVEKKERVDVPVWAGVIAIVAGGALLASSRKR